MRFNSFQVDRTHKLSTFIQAQLQRFDNNPRHFAAAEDGDIFHAIPFSSQEVGLLDNFEVLQLVNLLTICFRDFVKFILDGLQIYVWVGSLTYNSEILPNSLFLKVIEHHGQGNHVLEMFFRPG